MSEIKAIETVYKGYRYAGALPRPARKRLSVRADLAGRKIGRLLVIEDLGVMGDSGYRLWGCICDCGTKKAVRSRELLKGHTRSCGCLQAECRASRGGHNRLPEGESAFNQLFYAYQKSARARGYDWHLSADQFRAITQQDCHYCGATPTIKFRAVPGTNGDYYGNGVDRVDNGKGYDPGNVVSCCQTCNVAKASMSQQEFFDWIARVYAHAARSARFEHGESPKA